MAKLRPAMALLVWAVSTGPAAAGGMDNTISRVHSDLQAMLHCEWQGSRPYTICPTSQMRDVVGLYADASGDYPETVEFHPLLTVVPADSAQNKLSHDTVVAILRYFFSDWKEQDAWVSAALKAADQAENSEHVMRREGLTLYIRSLDIEDGEGSYALVVVTRKASIEPWTIDRASIAR